MFSDQRSRRVIFVAHCILNQNAISDGTACYPAAHTAVIQAILDAQAGIVQLPCPELCCLGLDRGNPAGADSPVVVENTRIRAAMMQPETAARLEQMADDMVRQMAEYQGHGFELLGVVGVNRSPCCGVDTTSDQNQELEGQGVFIQALQVALKRANLSLPVIGIRGTPDAAEAVRSIL